MFLTAQETDPDAWLNDAEPTATAWCYDGTPVPPGRTLDWCRTKGVFEFEETGEPAAFPIEAAVAFGAGLVSLFVTKKLVHPIPLVLFGIGAAYAAGAV